MVVIALMCWHCDSVQNDYCGEPFTGRNATNANSTYIKCQPRNNIADDTKGTGVCVKAKVKGE